MRLVAVGLFMVACGQFGSPEANHSIVLRSESAASSPSNVGAGPADPLPLPSNPVGPSSPISELCFSLSDEVEAMFPAIRERLTESGAAWGWPVSVGPNCGIPLYLDDLPQQQGSWPYASARSIAKGGRLRLNRYWAGKFNGLLDVFPEACDQDVILRAVLTHEIGHILGVPHSDDEASAMNGRQGRCEEHWPLPSDIAAALQPTL